MPWEDKEASVKALRIERRVGCEQWCGCCLVGDAKGLGLEQMAWAGESKETADGSPSYI